MKKIVAVLCLLLLQQGICQNVDPSAEFDAVLKGNREQGPQSFLIILDPKERTDLSTRIASPVKKIYKRMGDSFKKGDILVQLEDSVYEANYQKAKAAREKTQAELDAKRALYGDDAASFFELKEAEAKAASSLADLVSARESLEETMLKAPYDGKVVNIYLQENELPETGAKVAQVIYDQSLLAKFLVSSNERIFIGMPVSIKLVETGEMIEAKITRISPEIEPASRTIKVEAEVDNRDGKWVAGMSGIVYLEGKDERNERSTTRTVEENSPASLHHQSPKL